MKRSGIVSKNINTIGIPSLNRSTGTPLRYRLVYSLHLEYVLSVSELPIHFISVQLQYMLIYRQKDVSGHMDANESASICVEVTYFLHF